MLWKSQIRLKQKIGLTILFGAGIFVMIAGIIRCVIILSNPATGAQQAGNWAVRESFVAVVIGNLPMIYPVLHRGVRRLTGSQRSSKPRSDMPGMSGSGSRTFELGRSGMFGGGARKGAAGGAERRESFATDDSRGRIVEPGFGDKERALGISRTVETEVHVEDGASASESSRSYITGFGER